MKKRHQISGLFVVGFLTCAVAGTYVFSQKVWATAQVLGAKIDVPEKISVMKVIKQANAAVIVPRESVFREEEENFVLTVVENQVSKTPVQASVWREDYAKISAGLQDQDLVILNRQLLPGQEVMRYAIINSAEAGKSGLVRN